MYLHFCIYQFIYIHCFHLFQDVIIANHLATQKECVGIVSIYKFICILKIINVLSEVFIQTILQLFVLQIFKHIIKKTFNVFQLIYQNNSKHLEEKKCKKQIFVCSIFHNTFSKNVLPIWQFLVAVACNALLQNIKNH